MQPKCERCGRTLTVLEAAPGVPARVATCSCGHAPAIARAAGGAARPARATAPLPSPREGNLEVDPWSLPPPEDGYETLTLDDGPAAPAAPSPPEEVPEPDAAAATPLEAATAQGAEDAEDAGAVDATPAAPARRSRAIVLGAVAGAVVAAAIAAWLVLGRSADPRPGGHGVRVTVTQEVSWLAPPPLAPADPSFKERARPEAAPVRSAAVASPPPRSSAATAPPARPRGAAPADVAPPPAPVATPESEPPPPRPEQPDSAAPERVPAAAPAFAAAAASADIPLPPPPVLAAPQVVAPAAAPAGKGRAPALQTRSCVEDALRVPRGLEGRLPAEVLVHLQVGEDGRAADVKLPGVVDPRLASALTAAVRTCRFAPGTAADGRPAAAPTTMRVRFEP